MLSFVDASFKYKNSSFLFENLNLNIKKGGQIKCILGPSGIGKSSLILLALKELSLYKGKVEVNGKVLPVFQNFEDMILPWVNIKENILWGIKTQCSEIEFMFNKLLDILEIRNLVDSYPHQLSGGQKQRVVLARAIVNRPQLCLFDEPLSNLDNQLSNRVATQISTLLKESGISVMWVTHDIHESTSVSDAIVVMDKNLKLTELKKEEINYGRVLDLLN